MNSDELKKIKKYYGEYMAHFCRDNFATILETENKLLDILLKNIYPSHNILKDIKYEFKEEEFKEFIYNKSNPKRLEKVIVNKDPKELMSDAGYNLYKCTNESEIQSFKKYYKESEALCTFMGNRLDRCYVYFAVKKNIDEIKREDFEEPSRQDLYGTSVISIQFTKDDSHVLSIKNRYNHTVKNPDATFSNNLDNIIPGLTESFSKYYGMRQNIKSSEFELRNYVRDNSGKMYKYNSEYNNVYCCPNNVVLNNFNATIYDTSRYLLINNLLIDFSLKKITAMDIDDGIVNDIGTIKKIIVNNLTKVTKEIKIINDREEEIIFIVNDSNQIINFKYDTLKQTSNNFLHSCIQLKNISMSSLEIASDKFLCINNDLESYNLPNLLEVKNDVLNKNSKINIIDFPKLYRIGNGFLEKNSTAIDVKLPNVETIGNSFLSSHYHLKSIDLPKVKYIGSEFLKFAEHLYKVNLPNVLVIGNEFVVSNDSIQEIYLPKVEAIGTCFLYFNKRIHNIEMPMLTIAENYFLAHNEELTEVKLENLVKVGKNFLMNNEELKSLILPKLEEIDYGFLHNNKALTDLYLPSVVTIDGMFLANNNSIKKIVLPKVKKIGYDFLKENSSLEEIYMPWIVRKSLGFLENNNNFKRKRI